MPANVLAGLRRDLRYFFHEEKWTNFAGGLNLRDDLIELQQNESPDLWNVTLDERGGVLKRLGYTRWNASAAANLFTYGYYSKLLNLVFWYSKADGKLYSDPGTGVLTLRKTFTVGSDIQIADFVGKTYATHPVDGLFNTTDGVTWNAVVASAGSVPKGALLCVWQNKLWVAADPAATNTVYGCSVGDATNWSTTAPNTAVTNQIRDKDDAPIVCLFGGSGVDFQNAPSMLVFKEESFYRVIDATTAAYRSVDGSAGTVSYQSVVTRYGKTFFLSKHGIFETNGVSAAVSVSEKIAPLFTSEALNYGKQGLFRAGWKGDRIYFSAARAGATTVDLALEYNPLQGWFTAGSNAMGCYVTYGNNDEQLLGASPTVTGRAYKLLSGGADDAAAIQSWFLTRPFEPTASHEARLQKIRVDGRGTIDVSVLTDFQNIGGARQTISLSPAAAYNWNGTTWGGGLWVGSSTQAYTDVNPRKVGKSFQIRIDETSSATASENALLESGIAPTVGAWALYGLDLQYTPLGLS